jgi:acyl CoA:acetate/3-ketoacid CoA transferase beta subunit
VSDFTRSEQCVAACADVWRGAGEVLASAIGTIPTLGARLAKATFEPDLLVTDGGPFLVDGVLPIEATVTDHPDAHVEGLLPFSRIFDIAWHGRRHVLMGAAQLDAHGNQNISCIGDWARPDRQLVGVRGAPGNTVNHPTSYWIPRHDRRTFVEHVDVVCGVGTDRARKAGPAATEFHHLHRVVTDLAVLDFETPERRMRLRSVHAGVTVDDVVAATGFELEVPRLVPTTRAPTACELSVLRTRLDRHAIRDRELPCRPTPTSTP